MYFYIVLLMLLLNLHKDYCERTREVDIRPNLEGK